MPKCSILEFSVDFEFRSLLHSHFAMLFFDHVVTTMVNAFLDRSQQLYGLEAIPRQKPQILKYRK
ncbi:unnamed protein product [Protopolystoma xenopodis]|uniref:Coenzyme Q-binding protein COQ10 START domain-containing protein n=1 Tax=Protopolystoma xenopodis TaxID=117903 RepID=A0A448WTQ9_9PLAT|nr:unnamed protein product [Protopolystoma xenopodis]